MSTQSNYAGERKDATAREKIDRLRADEIIQRGAADPSSDEGQIAAVFKACDSAVAELEQKRQHLQEQGHLTTSGMLEALRPEAERLAAELNTLNERVIAPRKARVLDRARTLADERPNLEPTAEDHVLAQRYASLPQEQRMRHLSAALAGKDLTLARALAASHPLLTGLTDENCERLRAKFGPQDGGEEQTLLTRAKDLSEAERRISQTITKISESV